MLTWRRDAESALANSLVLSGLLPSSGREITDQVHWASVRDQVEAAARSLDQSAGVAPTIAASSAAAGSAKALRELVSALESERLLFEGPGEVTAAQASEVGQSESDRRAELDAALSRLENQVRPVQGKPE